MAKTKSKKRRISVLKKVGLPPGSITYIGKERTENAVVELIRFNSDQILKEPYHRCEDVFKKIDIQSVNWINVDGIHNHELLNEFASVFKLHHLLLEDVANTNQRPKLEEYNAYLFLSLKMLLYNEIDQSIDNEQVSLVLGKNYVISFQEKTGDVFGNIRERIESSKGQIRNKGADYLFYSLIDSIIDNYFTVIENVGNNLEDLEEQIFNDPSQDSLEKIQKNKNLLLTLRRSIYPLRESISRLIRDDENEFIDQKTIKYFNDVYDHTVHIIDILESYKDIVTGLKDSYMSSLSFKMNQIMQVLTIIATIFIPLTFIAGIYGMNFDNLPELHWPYGYLYFWMVTIVLVILLVFYFKRKKWL